MWTFVEVAQIAERFGSWSALVTLEKNSVQESFYVKFTYQPTVAQATTAGQNLATQKNVEEAPVVSHVITKYAFRMRFTLAERIALDTVDTNAVLTAEQKLIAQTLLHDFAAKENGVEITNADTIAGVQYLESIGLLASGRASVILGL